MKRRCVPTILAVLSLLCVLGWSGHGQKAQPSRASNLQTWEYKIAQVDGEARLNELGAQGWELVGFEGIEPGSHFKNCVLKRAR